MRFTQLLVGLVLALHSGGLVASRQPQPARFSEGHAVMMNVNGWDVLKGIAAADVKGLSSVSYDIANNSLTYKGTSEAVQTVDLLIRKLEDATKSLRRFHVRYVDPKALYEKVISGKPIRGIDFISYDPTDFTVIARGTSGALDTLGKVLADLDKK